MKQVFVYTTDYCPYCTKAKNLLKNKGVAFEEVDVSGDQEARIALVKKSGGRKTVPQIFIGDMHVGGFDDLDALNKADGLDKLLD